MGKGAGCLQSKSAVSQDPASRAPDTQKEQHQVNATPAQQQQRGKMAPTVFVIYYSTYGHIAKMAKEVVAGLESEGVTVKLFQVPETLSEEILGKMHAPPKDDSVPVIQISQLLEADGFVFGFPTRFGNMAGQFKQFWDATGQIWQKGQLAGKPFGIFTSTASQGGGQELTIANSLSNFIHHAMIFVPPGYGYGTPMFALDAVRGGSAFGAGTFAGGDGSRQPSDVELGAAKYQGTNFGVVVKKLAA